MRTALILAAFLLVACSEAKEPEKKSPSNANGTEPEWTYHVQFPGATQRKAETTPSPAGPLTMNIETFADKEGHFEVIWVDYPPGVVAQKGVAAILEGAVQGGATSVGGKIVEDRKIRVAGHPGRDVLVQGTPPVFFRHKVVLAGRRVFTVGVRTSMERLDSARVRRFMGSFRLERRKK